MAFFGLMMKKIVRKICDHQVHNEKAEVTFINKKRANIQPKKWEPMSIKVCSEIHYYYYYHYYNVVDRSYRIEYFNQVHNQLVDHH